MKKVLVVLLVMSLCLIAGQTMAAKVMTPESLDGATVVDAEWVKQNEGKVMVFDARKKGEYVEGHIPGSISVPYKEKSEKTVDFDPSKDKWDMSKYPSDKNASIVVYCNGVKCWKSYKTIVLLAKAGYTNLHWLRDGFPGWQEKGYTVE
ncbi:MAG: rhodanese-like domain-containing protein [Nitrospiraceae bacterium]|nr:MAG: rhodanese-like domain-containing protein [Nitrospiraceae bacterium]